MRKEEKTEREQLSVETTIPQQATHRDSDEDDLSQVEIEAESEKSPLSLHPISFFLTYADHFPFFSLLFAFSLVLCHDPKSDTPAKKEAYPESSQSGRYST